MQRMRQPYYFRDLLMLVALAVLLCGLPAGSLAQDDGRESAQSNMKWIPASNSMALCNDFTQAGFFIRKTTSNNWVVFLESGGLCFNSETCNRRFFTRTVRCHTIASPSQTLSFPPSLVIARHKLRQSLILSVSLSLTLI